MYGLDLRDTLWGETPVGVRRLAALVSNLPLDCATYRALDPNEGWSQEDELLATIVDMIGVGNHMFLAANTDKNKVRLPDPERFPRPWASNDVVVKESPLSSSDEMRAFFMSGDDPVVWDAHGEGVRLN